jgi:hypothetical protein
MSRIFLQANPVQMPSPTEANDDSIHLVEEQYSRDGMNGQIYSDIIWPRSRLLAGANQAGSPPWDHIALSYGIYPWITRLGGGFEPWQVFGRTLDQNSNTVALATCSLIDVTTGTVVDTQTSDNSGSYAVGNPYGAGRGFVYAQKGGSPDVAGASDNNLP